MSSLSWFSIHSTPSPGVGSSRRDRPQTSERMFEVRQIKPMPRFFLWEDANSVLNVRFSIQDFWGYTFLFLRSTGDPKVQTVVARSQPTRRRRQCSTESPGASEEQRIPIRYAGMLATLLPFLLVHHNLLTPLLSSAANNPQNRRWPDTGHELLISAGQSLAGIQRLLQNVRHTKWQVLSFLCLSETMSPIHQLLLLFFAHSTVNTLGVLTGKLLLGMTKEEIRTVCPEEGSKVFFQLQAVKSSIAVKWQVTYAHTDCILR